MQTIRFIKRLANAKTPTQGTAQAAGFDLYAAHILIDTAAEQLVVDTGLNVSFDPDHVLMIHGRSGLASKYGIRLSNGVGVVDADYRGPLKVILRSDRLTLSELIQQIKVGDRVAQAILMPIPEVRWQHVYELDATDRGEGGFGSTGS